MRTRIPLMSLAVLFAAMALACDDEGSTPVAPAEADLAVAPINGPVLNTVGAENDGEVIHMCYMPTSGNVYRIKEADKHGRRSTRM